MTQRSRRVLISGAGPAGATLAALLARAGHRVVLVERDQGVRSSGNPVDVRGAAFDVVEGLGLLGELDAVATRVRRLVVVDDAGRPVGSIATRKDPVRELEVPRSDLSALLVAAAQRSGAELRFDETVAGIAPDAHGAEVAFEHAEAERFDLVVAADGIHSRVRRLAFGPEEDFVRPLGIVVATVPVAGLDLRPDTVLLHNRPGSATALHPGAGRPGVAFLFRSDANVDIKDPAAARALLEEVYGRSRWRVRELLTAYGEAEDTYFDRVSRVRTPTWSRGPVVLLGDAASCVTLFGEGSSAAIAGAAVLAQTLASGPDVGSALTAYEQHHRGGTRRGQRGASVASHLLIPATAAGLSARNIALRLAGRLGRSRS